MEELGLFAAFLLQHHLEPFVQEQLKALQARGTPLLQQILETTNEELLYQRSLETQREWLGAIASGQALGLARHNMDRWLLDRSPTIPLSAVTLSDIVWVQRVQKSAMIRMLPLYATRVEQASAILLSLEDYYFQVQQLSIRTFETIQQAETQKLQETEQRYKDILDHANDMVHMALPDGSILYINNAWSRTLGYSPEELQGKTIYQYVREQDRNSFRLYRERIIADPLFNESIEVGFLTREGEEVFVEGYVTCNYRAGQPAYTRGILHNITMRKQNEAKLRYFNEQLQEREESLTQLIRHAPDAIIVIDEESIIRIWNPKASEIFGWQEEEALGQLLMDMIIPPAYREAHTNGIRRHLATGESRMLNKTIEITALHRSGLEFYIALTISRSVQSGHTRFIAFIRNIDQQKRDQLELERNREQLLQTNKELEQYAWLASHDLKEPVRKILTFSDMLRSRHWENLDAMGQLSLEKIHESASRMIHLMEAIQQYATITGEEHLRVETNLNLVILEVTHDLEPLIRESGASIRMENSLPSLSADPVQLRQLFQQLITNAIHYRKKDVAPSITISSEQSCDQVRIRVKDNGQGFEAVYANRIFKIFQRLVNRDQLEGTGIGLALCKKIVEHHGGSITAFSVEGEGSVFEILLPLDTDPTPGV